MSLFGFKAHSDRLHIFTFTKKNTTSIVLSMTTTDNAMIEKAKRGDRAAFRQLLEEHYDMMYRVAYRFTGQKHDAEDIAQAVCEGLVHKLVAFRGDSLFSSWLYRIVINACHDAYKKKSTHRKLEYAYTELEASSHAESEETGKQVAWLYRAIAVLEPSLKETALLVLTEEVSHAEAGKILGCAESTISWRMAEVKKNLRKAWEQGDA